MIVRGWLYLITNDAMPGLTKVGFSLKDPVRRASELSTTGSPLPFKVCYDALVKSPRDLEQAVHSSLAEMRAGKEWFRCEVIDAAQRIRDLAGAGLLQETWHIDLPFVDRKTSREKLSAPVPERKRATSCPMCRMTNIQEDKPKLNCIYCGAAYHVMQRKLPT